MNARPQQALPETVVLAKLGGSLLTDKQQERALRAGELGRIAGEVARAHTDLRARGVGCVLGHGSGSFGHVAAARAGYCRDQRERRSSGAGAIQHEAAALHHAVAGALLAQGVETFSLLPGSFVVADGGGREAVFSQPLAQALRNGLLVLTQGDVVMDLQLGYTICSTEAVLLAAAEALAALGVSVREVLFFGETDGLLGEHGRTLPTIGAGQREELRRVLAPPSGTDVTGGMELRLATVLALAERGIRSRLLNGLVAGTVERALSGLAAGGTIVLAQAVAPGVAPR